MIVVRLMGGLGNQMFQYATGRALALRHGVELRLDRSYLDRAEGPTPREYALGCFRLEARWATRRDMRWMTWGAPTGAGGRARDLVKRFLRPGRLQLVEQAGPGFDPSPLSAGRNTLLIGYWQSEDFFRDAEAEIRRDFEFKVPLDGPAADLAEEIRATNPVSVHVRRGDYVANSNIAAIHGSLAPDWYTRAAAEVVRRTGDVSFFVFSDDPRWCSSHLQLPGRMRVVAPAERPQNDLRLMSLCSHHVIANSSFSWWGAWLDNRPDNVVVAPRAWFADPAIDTRRVTPPGWLRL